MRLMEQTFEPGMWVNSETGTPLSRDVSFGVSRESEFHVSFTPSCQDSLIP